MVVCGALIVAPESTVYAPQELAHKRVGLDYGNGTAYAGLQMLEGAMPRAAITTSAYTADPSLRLAALMDGEIEATVLQEPWITVALKAGCRLVSSTFFHGTWVADRRVDADTYAAFLRADKRAVERINADKRGYVSYFIREAPNHPQVQALTPNDFDLSRIQVQEPRPISEAEARWSWQWMASWGFLEGEFDLDTQINRSVERLAHEAATLARS